MHACMQVDREVDSGGNLAPSLGGRKIFASQDVFRIFTDFRIFTLLNVVHDPLYMTLSS